MVGQKKYIAILFILPALIFLFGFIYFPLVQNFYYSFFEFSPISQNKIFKGLSNYKELVTDNVIYIALRNNFLYAAISFIFQVALSFIIAAILEDRIFRKVSNFFRVLYFIPLLASVTVVAFIFQFFYDPYNGLFNILLQYIGLADWQQAWLGNPNLAIFSVIATSQWQSMGYTTMLYLVAIQSIPKDLYESAQMDGASKIKQFFYITLPLSREIIFVVTVITLTGAFKVFGEPYILTGGGPGNASMVLSTYMYKTAFSIDRMGYAATIALLIFIFTMLISLLQVKLFKTGE